jgi:hypothetical protein
MAELTPEQEAGVRNTIKWPWNLDEPGHRKLTQSWSLQMFDFAETFVRQCSSPELLGAPPMELRKLRAERAEILKEPNVHWTTTPGFWVAVFALVLAIAALIVAILK